MQSTAVHAVSDSIMGPYIDKGPLYTWGTVCMRDDSSYLAVCRDGFIMLSTTGIGGPYVVKTDKIWPASLAGYNTANWEDHDSKVIVIPFNGEGFDGLTGAATLRGRLSVP